MTLRVLGADDVLRLPMLDAVAALRAVFTAPVLPQAPPRARIGTSSGEFLVMPAAGEAGAGAKLVTVNPANPGRGQPLIHAVYVLFDEQDGRPLAAMDGGALTALRTGAVSALATDLLARTDSKRLVVFGAGVQAAAHLEAIAAVRPIDRVAVVSRSGPAAERLADEARARGLAAEVAGPEVVSRADVVCTCTTSAAPVFDGSLLAAGAHVNAIGTYRPQDRELDEATLTRAKIVVETRGAVLAEAGDLAIPIGSGVLRPEAVVADLAEVARGVRVRTGDEDITVFKSVGVAFEDLAIARAVFDRTAGSTPDSGRPGG